MRRSSFRPTACARSPAIIATPPFRLPLEGTFAVEYEPGEARTGLFGGNSNWRGPVWVPDELPDHRGAAAVSSVLRGRLQGGVPDGIQGCSSLAEVADEIAGRLLRLFLPGPDGRRPYQGSGPALPGDQDLLLFHEYFDGEDGRGLGASHQTGWTSLVAELLRAAGRARRRSRRRAAGVSPDGPSSSTPGSASDRRLGATPWRSSRAAHRARSHAGLRAVRDPQALGAARSRPRRGGAPGPAGRRGVRHRRHLHPLRRTARRRARRRRHRSAARGTTPASACAPARRSRPPALNPVACCAVEREGGRVCVGAKRAARRPGAPASRAPGARSSSSAAGRRATPRPRRCGARATPGPSR